MTVSEVAERVEERVKPVRNRITRRRETPAERLKGTVESAADRLAEQARERKESLAEITGRAGGSRGASGRVSDVVSERFEADTARTWSARLALLGAGFLLGFLLGWLARAGRDQEDSETVPEGLARSPAGMPRGSSLESEAAPSL
ncbi:MAG: hypothetical protein M3O70_12825 [Actinomycetota bacterium]|nr:hypothetical protein [Actinomycetota bacterium]